MKSPSTARLIAVASVLLAVAYGSAWLSPLPAWVALAGALACAVAAVVWPWLLHHSDAVTAAQAALDNRAAWQRIERTVQAHQDVINRINLHYAWSKAPGDENPLAQESSSEVPFRPTRMRRVTRHGAD